MPRLIEKILTSYLSEIYNLFISNTASENIGKGEQQIIWNKTDNSNRRVADGVYFIAIEKENKPERVKVIIR